MTQLHDFEVRNRWTNAVQFTAKIEADPSVPFGIRLGLAVKWGLANKANLGGANLYGADLGGANLRSADLGGADLRSAYLGGAYLGGAYLGGANLRSANLRSANLRSADLRSAYLGSANLRSADLRSAYLGGAYLGGADLRSAYLGGAYLGGADLRSADLGGADLGGADLGGADLGGADLGGDKIVRIFARVQRENDPYLFMGVELEAGGYKVAAGCRWFTDAEFREHVADAYPDTPKAEETLAILDFIAARAKAMGVAEASAEAA